MNINNFQIIVFLCSTVTVCFSYQNYYMTQRCNANLPEDNAGRLETAYELTYAYNMNCWTTISVPSDRRIYMTFKRFDVEVQTSGACTDELNIYDGSSTSSPLLSGGMCGQIIGEFNMTSSGSHVTFHFITDSSAVYRGFDVIYVGFKTAPCGSGEFACGNNGGMCIDGSLQCDDIDQCGDNSDEAACSLEELESREGTSYLGIIIGCILAGVVMILIVVLIIYKCYIYYYWKNWLKRNQSRKYPWEENDDDLYRYPKTDKYQVYEIGKKGRLEPKVSQYFAEEKRYYYENKVAEDDFGRYLDEQ